METPKRYDALCNEFDREEAVKTEFVQMFTKKFATFMGCSEDCICLKFAEAPINLHPIEYRSEILFTLSTKVNKRTVNLGDIAFTYQQDQGANYQHRVGYNGVKGILETDTNALFFALLKMLESKIVAQC